MTFVSFYFYIFLAVLIALYYIMPLKFRWLILLAGSIGFYLEITSFSKFAISVLVLEALICFLSALLMRTDFFKKESAKKKAVMIITVVITVLPLLIIKKVFNVPINLFSVSNPESLIVPVGISFFTLQLISYVVDVYNEKIEPEKNYLKFLLFVSFFPQIIQGPIPRFSQLSRQLISGNKFDEEKFVDGFKLILWGFFLKLCIADKSAVIVNSVFDNYLAYKGFYVLIAGFLYSIQLYADFLSCTTLAQGISMLFGIELINNFERPYFADSIKDFWRRWHISLSTWLRDYVYIPLGGNRLGKIRKYINLLLTFIVSGIWHGTGFKFLFWGLMHGVYQVMGDILSPFKDYVSEKTGLNEHAILRKIIKTCITFFLVMTAWIIFRADSLKSGLIMIKSMFTVFNPWILTNDSLFALGLSLKDFGILIICLLVLLFVEIAREKGADIRKSISKNCLLVRWIIYIGAIIFIMLFGTYGFGFDAQAFIYGGF